MPTSAMNPMNKKLSACDECRTRKLKCSGEPARCSRCQYEGITCHYSQRKTMGRPRKRRREETGDTNGSMGTSGGKSVGAVDVEFQDLDPTTLSGNGAGLGKDGFQFSDDNFERHDMVSFEAEIGPSSSNIDASSLGLLEGSAFDLDQDFPDWVLSPELGPPFSTPVNVPPQLQTPPNAPNDVDGNNHTAGDPVIGCSCLSNLYSMLAKFQSPPEPSFPFSMGTLRGAAALCRGVVTCHGCGQVYSTALQNAMLLGTLLQLLIIEYAKLLGHIDEQSKKSEKIAFRLGDPSSLYDSRHTGLPDCPMAINVALSSDEWRTLARKAVAQEVHGGFQGSLGLTGLIQQMKDRQVSWRERFSTGQCTAFHSPDHQHSPKHPDHLCPQALYIENLRRSIEALGL